MARRDVVVIAASAGGIEALRQVLGGLPANFDGVILVVLHIPAEGGRSLAAILDRAGHLPATTAIDGEPLKAGRIYVCAPDHHLLLGDGHVHVRRGPRENGHRPAADPLFRSAARYYGARVIAVVLSGTLSDGTAGLRFVRREGGIAIVQEPRDALYDGMPTRALKDVGADHVVPARAIGPLLYELSRQEVTDRGVAPSEDLRAEVTLYEADDRVLDLAHPGRPSEWPCPDCNGVLWEIEDDEVLRFRCRVGHAWGADNLLHQQGAEVEAAVWVALRSLEDRVALSRTVAERAEAEGRTKSAARFRDHIDDMTRSIAVLRRLLKADEMLKADDMLKADKMLKADEMLKADNSEVVIDEDTGD
jgi:two-component system chemotaxis response regulator CheB